MWGKLEHILKGKYTRKDDLSRQIEIAQVLDAVREQIKKTLPNSEGIIVVSLKNKVLSIHTPSSVVASELRMYSQEIIHELNRAFGKEMVSRVIYRF